MSIACPSPAILRNFLKGRTSDICFEDLEQHLKNCVECQNQLLPHYDSGDSLSLLIADAVGKAGDSQAGMWATGPLPVPPLPDSKYSQPAKDVVMRDYRILEQIGQGGMGSVYRAFHTRLAKQVALKTLNWNRAESKEAISRFKREMIVSAQLDHPHIVRVLDAGEHEGTLYYVMELISGIDLSQLVRRLGPLPVPEACQIIRVAASALQFAHDRNVIHRDVKPSNLMLTGEGKVKLLDLGLAQYFNLEEPGEDEISRVGQAVGTRAYMSPEQIARPHSISPQSDIFSLGLTFHELLTGRRPCDPKSTPTLVAEMRSMRADVDEALLNLVRDMLAISPAERPTSMLEVESRLAALSPPTNLAGLVAEYYRWSNRSSLGVPQDLAAAETDPRPDHSTTPQSAAVLSGNKILPPPVQTSPRQGSSFAWPMLVVAVVCGLATGGWLFSPPTAVHPNPGDSPLFPPVVVSQTGALDVVAMGDIAKVLLAEGWVTLFNLDNEQPYQVTDGHMEDLPFGKYRVDYEGPDHFLQDGEVINVSANTTNRLNLRPILDGPFQYPRIPDIAGSCASYRGEIWRVGWDQKSPLAFRLDLEVLSVSSDLPRKKWLLIKIYLPAIRYEEIAYLQIDASRSQNQELVPTDGFVVADSPEIKEFLTRRGGSGRPLVVPFDMNRDTLDDIDNLPLPSKRLSIHDVICLYFGEEETAAAESITTLRAKLAATHQRHEWLDLENCGNSDRLMLIESSRAKGEDPSSPGFRLARHKVDGRTPFSFVNLEVKSSDLQATCKMHRGGISGRTAAEAVQLIASLAQDMRVCDVMLKAQAQRSAEPETLPLAQSESPGGVTAPSSLDNSLEDCVPPPSKPINSWPFDLASLPNELSFTTWQGTIVRQGLPAETITATARYLGSELSAGRQLDWIEVEVNNVRAGEPDRWEAVRLQIDRNSYVDSKLFVIRNGWIAYGSKHAVFSMAADNNLDTLLDLRVQLRDSLQPERIGIVDVLAMLFAADLKPRSKFGELRAKLSGILAGAPRQMKIESSTLKGRALDCECWSPPAIFPPDSYKFLRSSEIPFGFVSVNLNVFDVKVNLEMSNQSGPLPADYSESVFGTPYELSELLAANRNRLQPVPNWRVWTWKQSGTTYKAWAEFGGPLETSNANDVLLRNAAGLEIRVPLVMLAQTDQQFVRQGRLWSKETFKGSSYSLQRVLVQDNESQGKLEFGIPSSPGLRSTAMLSEIRDEADRSWILKRRAAAKQKPEVLNNPQAWERFAEFKR